MWAVFYRQPVTTTNPTPGWVFAATDTVQPTDIASLPPNGMGDYKIIDLEDGAVNTIMTVTRHDELRKQMSDLTAAIRQVAGVATMDAGRAQALQTVAFQLLSDDSLPVPYQDPPASPVVSGVAQAGAVQLSWEPVVDADYYIVYRATTAGQEGNTAFAKTFNTTFTDAGLTSGIPMFYEVVAINHGGVSARSVEVQVTPT